MGRPHYFLKSGRVRQVGPPPPLMQSSEPGKVWTSKPRGAQAGVGGGVFFEGDQAVVAQGEDVAGQGVTLGLIDFDQAEVAGAEEMDGFDGEPG